MEADIKNILEGNLPESQTLEYKNYQFKDGKFNQLKERARNSLAKEISSFANAEGGSIIIGIEEDHNHNPSTAQDTKVTKETFETWEQSFRQFISAKIKPVIYGVECKLEVYEGNNLIRITVPDSTSSPHAFDDGNKDSFHIRYGNTINAMRLEDLRKSFQSREFIEQKILDLRDQRISKILSGDTMGDLDGDALLVLHIIPEWSMSLNSYVDLNELKDDYKLDVFSPERDPGSTSREGTVLYNYEGLYIYHTSYEGLINSYTQVLHNGIIESVERRMMNKPDSTHPTGSKVHDWNLFEEYLVVKIKELTSVISNHNIPKPLFIFVTLLNVKNKTTTTSGPFNDLISSDPVKANTVKTIPAYLSNENSISEALRPMLTNLAHTFGLNRSFLYNEDGTVNSDVFDD